MRSLPGIPFKLGGVILLFYYLALYLPERWPTAALKPMLSGPEEHFARRNTLHAGTQEINLPHT